ncbi:hypothetical protein MN116_000203, partial [Schistosoma mekongi]
SQSMFLHFYLTLLLIHTSKQSEMETIEVKYLQREINSTIVELVKVENSTRNVELVIKTIKDKVNAELADKNQTIDEYVNDVTKWTIHEYNKYIHNGSDTWKECLHTQLSICKDLLSTNNKSMCDVFPKPSITDINLLDMKLNTRRNYIHVYYHYLVKYRLLTEVLSRIETNNASSY